MLITRPQMRSRITGALYIKAPQLTCCSNLLLMEHVADVAVNGLIHLVLCTGRDENLAHGEIGQQKSP